MVLSFTTRPFTHAQTTEPHREVAARLPDVLRPLREREWGTVSSYTIVLEMIEHR